MADWSKIHQEKRIRVWSLPLALFSLLYGLGVRFRLGLYAWGILKGRSLPGFVVSVGNLTSGGTGKTPAAAMLARWALTEGYPVAILSKGYGGRYKQRILEVSDGKDVHADPQTAGDEASLLARGVAGCPVIVSKNRHRAGMYAHKKFGSGFFILDDGFQHLELQRDVNLLLIDTRDPFGNGHLLPWGPLREPLDQMGRADAIILTRFSRAQGPPGSPKRDFSSIPLFYADHVPDRVVFPLSGESRNPGFLRKKKVLAFAGIAHPELFEETLVGLDVDVIRFKGFKDHYLFRESDMKTLIRLKESIGARYLLTTEKDWMRIAALAPAYADMAYLSIRFSFLPGQEGLFSVIKDQYQN